MAKAISKKPASGQMGDQSSTQQVQQGQTDRPAQQQGSTVRYTDWAML